MLRYGHAPDPQLGEGELLVRVRATASTAPTPCSGAAATRRPLAPRRSWGSSCRRGRREARAIGAPGDRVMAVVTSNAYAELATMPAGMAHAHPRKTRSRRPPRCPRRS